MLIRLTKKEVLEKTSKNFAKIVDIGMWSIYNNQVGRRKSSDGNGILAQLGEHLPYKQGVTGSSPVGPIFLKNVTIIYGEVAQLARASGSYPGG